MHKVTKKWIAVLLLAAIGVSGVWAIGLGVQNTFDSWFGFTARLNPGPKTWAFNLGYSGTYGISASGEYYFIDSPFVTFGETNEFAFNWYVGAGAYVRGLGFVYAFSVGAYPIIGLSFWWDVPNANKDKLEVFLNWAPQLGIAVWNNNYANGGWYDRRNFSVPVTFDLYGLANYRLGLRYHFKLK